MSPLEKFRTTVARGKEQRAADLTAGHARIGGLWSQPNYLRSYLNAARVIMREARASGSLNPPAVACAYMQRHVLELALKALIDMFHTVADNDDEINRLTGNSRNSTAPPNGERERAAGSHNLDALLRDLLAARQREMDEGASYCELPADLAILVGEFSALEGRQTSRLRYPTVRVNGQYERSFDEEITIPIEPWQVRLDALVDVLFESGEVNRSADSLGWELGTVINGQFQTLYDAGAM